MISHSASPGRRLAPHHATPGRPRKSRPGYPKALVVIALIAVVAAFATAAFMMRPKGGATAATPEAFVDQMESAAEGAMPERNVFGGTMTVDRKGNQVTVTAANIPPNICVSVGWKLVRKGILTINGTTPLRVSAAKLAELCNQTDGNATLAWSPKTSD